EPAAVRFNAEAIGLANEGRFREAVDRLRMALGLAPNHPVITRNLQTVLFNWSATDLAQDNNDAAVDHLLKAAQLGERPEVRHLLGVAYLKQGEYAQAAAELEHALKLAANEKNTMVVLAQVYLKQDKRPQALDLLQRAKEAGASG